MRRPGAVPAPFSGSNVSRSVPPDIHSGCLTVAASSSTIARMVLRAPTAWSRTGRLPRAGASASSARATVGGGVLRRRDPQRPRRRELRLRSAPDSRAARARRRRRASPRRECGGSGHRASDWSSSSSGGSTSRHRERSSAARRQVAGVQDRIAVGLRRHVVEMVLAAAEAGLIIGRAGDRSSSADRTRPGRAHRPDKNSRSRGWPAAAASGSRAGDRPAPAGCADAHTH